MQKMILKKKVIIVTFDEKNKTSINKDSKEGKHNKINKRNNCLDIEQMQSIENSRNIILSQKSLENKEIKENQKKIINKEKNTKKDVDNNSKSVFLHNKKENEIKGSLIKQEINKSVY